MRIFGKVVTRAFLRPHGRRRGVIAARVIIITVIFLGISWKRINREGAIATRPTGLIPTFANIWHSKIGAGKAGTAHAWFLGVSPEPTRFVFMIVALVLAAAVSLASQLPPHDIQDLVEVIRVPGTRTPHGIADSGMAPVDWASKPVRPRP